MFEKVRIVRFRHCDPAGMVFYPRYVEMVHAAVEDWFADALGVTFAELHGPRQASVPVVTFSMEFFAPSRLGDALSIAVAVEHVGTSSLQLAINGRCGDEPRFASSQKLVHIRMIDHRSRPWEADMRAALERCLAEDKKQQQPSG
ncbi:thioesterase family protein [Shinella sp. DD12]|uniref:acyl-CoA thioesterase n=1 Tax=Shinella sp. DD12 TaxID=1410620 RepID=UPI0003C54101|nr:thioesterase family protein [Shinella sp. DD12]EYR83790.1 putative thioesterase [Shinella sp. DD12]